LTKSLLRLAILAAALVLAASAQSPASGGPSFEVATVKPVELTPGNYNANLGTVLHGEVQMSNVTLNDCLKFAYSISNDIQIEGPAWIRNKDIRFEITAKSTPDTPRAQLLLMLQRLLAERFQLVLHHEPKERSFLALSVGKKGSKLQAVPEDTPNPPSTSIAGRIASKRMPMSILTLLLSRFTGKPVVDMTGLTGYYEIHLEWTPEPLAPTGATPVSEQSGPSVYSAVQDQLGLKLESRKGPLDILIVDHAEKTPTAN
jgi:uncharacterized protein (TIGR03435 family)